MSRFFITSHSIRSIKSCKDNDKFGYKYLFSKKRSIDRYNLHSLQKPCLSKGCESNPKGDRFDRLVPSHPFFSLLKNPRHRLRALVESHHLDLLLPPPPPAPNERNTFGTHVPWTEILNTFLLSFSLRFTSSPLPYHSLLITKTWERKRRSLGEGKGISERRESPKKEVFTGRSISNHTRLLLLSFSRLVEKKKSQKKKKRSWWLDCRHGSVFEAAHRAHFINGAGRVVDAFVCRLNVAADWPRSYKRGAWLATGRSGTVAPSEGDPCSRPPMFPRLSLSLSPPPVVFRLSTPLLSSSLPPPPKIQYRLVTWRN